MTNLDHTTGLTPAEWRALIFFHRVDELGQSAPSTDVRALTRQFGRTEDPTVRAGIAGLVGTVHAAAGSFAEAEHWYQVSTAQAPPATWVAARAAAYHANHLSWNGDLALAAAVLAEADPIDHPLSNFGVRIVGARIAFAVNDHPKVRAILATVVPEQCFDPLGIAEPVLALFVATLALAEDRRSDAEIAIRRSLLTSRPGTRAHALLVDQLGQVMARCGLMRETDACRRMAQAGLGRWPSEARGSNRSFERLLVALGLRAPDPDDWAERRWPSSAGRTGRAIVELQAAAAQRIADGDQVAARRSTAQLVTKLIEHTRPLESIEARSTAVRTLTDLPTLGIALGRLGDPGDALRLAMASMRIIVADQTRGRSASDVSDRLGELAEWAGTLEQATINRAELDDLGLRRLRLDRRRSPGVALPTGDWLERPLPRRPLVLFDEVDGRLWRVTSRDGIAEMTDLGPSTEIDRAVRVFRLAAAALALDHPDAVQRLESAATALDGLLFAGCVWNDGEQLTMVPGRVLTGLPWRLLPSIRRVHLGIAIGDPMLGGTARPTRRSVTVIRGPGLGGHNRSELHSIGRCYPVARHMAGPTMTPSHLDQLMAGTDVVHVAGHGRLDRTHLRLQRSVDIDRIVEEPSDSPAADSDPADPVPMDKGTTADVVVFGSCDLTLNAELGRSGLAWQLIDGGVSHVIASTIDLDDDETAIVMPALHRSLAEGLDPLEALNSLRFESARLQAAADSLICVCVGQPF